MRWPCCPGDMSLPSLTSTVTELVSHGGVPAVFSLLAVDALLPAGSELVMLLAGALAAGIAGQGAAGLPIGLPTYLAVALAGTLGYLTGAVAGWVVGRHGRRWLGERRGGRLNVRPQQLAHAERWFARHGRAALLLGRLMPFTRSFISIPAGVLGAPLRPYLALTALGSAIWCFGLAGAGWALGASWDAAHGAFHDIGEALVAALAAAVVWRLARRRVATG